MAVAENLGGIVVLHARPALRVHRRRRESGKARTRETVYAVTDLDACQATPVEPISYLRGEWSIENSSHHLRDRTFSEDASTVHTGSGPRVMAAFRNPATGAIRTAGATNTADTTGSIRGKPEYALSFQGINHNPNPSGT